MEAEPKGAERKRAAQELPPEDNPWRENELVRRQRLREDAKRPISVNLAEGIAFSEFALRFLGAARK